MKRTVGTILLAICLIGCDTKSGPAKPSCSALDAGIDASCQDDDDMMIYIWFFAGYYTN